MAREHLRGKNGGRTKGWNGYGWRGNIPGVNGGRTKGSSGYGWRGNISGVNRGDLQYIVSAAKNAFDTIEQKNEIVKTVLKKLNVKMFKKNVKTDSVERKKINGGVIMKMKLELLKNRGEQIVSRGLRLSRS